MSVAGHRSPWSAMSLAVLVASVAMVALPAGPARASAASYWHSCRPPSGLPIGSLQAHRIACGKARRVIDGFHCVGIVGGASCRRGAQRVRLVGSPERLRRSARSMPTTPRAESCPDATALERPANPRGAIPATKAALGSDGRVFEVRRSPGSTYAGAAMRSCGAEVLRDSVYLVVHPIGMTCSACNLHAYVVKFRKGVWKVWTAF